MHQIDMTVVIMYGVQCWNAVSEIYAKADQQCQA